MNLGSGVHTDADGYIAGTMPWAANRPTDRKIKTYDKERRCTCGARLSVYNEDSLCAPCSGNRWADH